MGTGRQYDEEYKVQAVKLAQEIGQAKAAQELGIPRNTLMGGYGRKDRGNWIWEQEAGVRGAQ